MKKVVLSAALLAILAVSATQAFAVDVPKDATKPQKPTGGKMFEALDTDKDGSISKVEFMAPHEARFVQMDDNKDSKVTHEEVKAFRAKKAEAHKAAMAAKAASASTAPKSQ